MKKQNQKQKIEAIKDARSYVLNNWEGIMNQYDPDYIGCSTEGTYLDSGIASHLLGLISEISSELGQEGCENYRLGDLIGKFGVEKQYESFLRGEDGYQKVEVNAKNRPIGFVDTKEAVAGNNIVLTIDF